jgi:hypothetical protein
MIVVIAALALFSGAPQLGKPPDPSIIYGQSTARTGI